MNFLRVEITKADLEKLPENERIFLFQLTHFLNEINILQKSVFISMNGIDSYSTIEKQGQISLIIFFIRILSGKLNEGWEMLKQVFFSSEFSKEYEKELPSMGKDSLKKLKQYFGRTNYINLIRNEFAFHYGGNRIKEELKKVDESEIFEMFLPEEEGRGVSLYAFSDLMVNRSILKSIDPDLEKATTKLMNEIVRDVSQWFIEFGGECLLVIVKKLGVQHSRIESFDVPSIREIRLPYFVKP